MNDPTNLAAVKFQRGRYVAGHLGDVLTSDHVRALRIRQAVERLVTDPNRMRALGFCVGVKHARFTAKYFGRAGYPSVALDANSPTEDHRASLTPLRQGKIRAIFAVDLLNEGVDLPEVDTVLMLRPTESATVFLRQLGWGLRWAEGKQVLTVLDFVGQVRRKNRHDVRRQAILGGTRHQVRTAVEADFPSLPPGCALKLDRQAKDCVLKNLREAVVNFRQRLAGELKRLGSDTRLGEFLRYAGVELEDFFSRPHSGHCFTDLRRRAGFLPATSADVHDTRLLRTVGSCFTLSTTSGWTLGGT